MKFIAIKMKNIGKIQNFNVQVLFNTLKTTNIVR